MEPDIELAMQASSLTEDETRRPAVGTSRSRIIRSNERSASQSSSLRAYDTKEQRVDGTPPARSSPASSMNMKRTANQSLDGTPPPTRSSHESLGFKIFRDGRYQTNDIPLDTQHRGSASHGPEAQPLDYTPPRTASLSGFDCSMPPPAGPPASYQPNFYPDGLPQKLSKTTTDLEREEILRLPFEKRVKEVFDQDIVYKNNGTLTMNLATLYRMRLHTLQSQIVKDVLDMRYHDPSNWGWEGPLKEYVQAWRDWDYMNECAKRKKDPFLIQSSRCLEAAVFREHLAGIRSTIAQGDSALLTKYGSDSTFIEPNDVKDPERVGGYRNKMNQETKLRGFVERLAMAAVGWVFIVGPVLLMVLHNTKLTALCTASVCVMAFGVLMARVLERPFDVMSATAAYAAVLVVFVGTANLG